MRGTKILCVSCQQINVYGRLVAAVGRGVVVPQSITDRRVVPMAEPVSVGLIAHADDSILRINIRVDLSDGGDVDLKGEARFQRGLASAPW